MSTIKTNFDVVKGFDAERMAAFLASIEKDICDGHNIEVSEFDLEMLKIKYYKFLLTPCPEYLGVVD